MNNQQENSDKIIREKFDKFAPELPVQIWEGIESKISGITGIGFIESNWGKIAAAFLLLMMLSGGIWYYLTNDESIKSKTISLEIAESPIISDLANNSVPFSVKPDQLTDQSENANEITTQKQISEQTETALKNPDQSKMIGQFESTQQFATGEAQIDETAITQILPAREAGKGINLIAENIPESGAITLTMIPSRSIRFVYFNNNRLLIPESENIVVAKKANTSSTHFWSAGLYFSPEVIFKDFDSVTLLTTYSINIEPTYYFNQHFFVRSGAGLSFASDRGFAKLDYISNELMGTYEDVYEMTFDSIGGQLVPTFHTKNTEVWDSVRRLTVTEVTNKYMYLQFPILFGFYKNNAKLDWYFYGGPAINLLVLSNIEEPIDNYESITVIDLKNNLPDRSPYFFQAWIGAGISFQATDHFSIALEPNYRYYFKGVYKKEPFKTGFSSFALRFGIAYKFY